MAKKKQSIFLPCLGNTIDESTACYTNNTLSLAIPLCMKVILSTYLGVDKSAYYAGRPADPENTSNTLGGLLRRSPFYRGYNNHTSLLSPSKALWDLTSRIFLHTGLGVLQKYKSNFHLTGSLLREWEYRFGKPHELKTAFEQAVRVAGTKNFFSERSSFQELNDQEIMLPQALVNRKSYLWSIYRDLSFIDANKLLYRNLLKSSDNSWSSRGEPCWWNDIPVDYPGILRFHEEHSVAKGRVIDFPGFKSPKEVELSDFMPPAEDITFKSVLTGLSPEFGRMFRSTSHWSASTFHLDRSTYYVVGDMFSNTRREVTPQATYTPPPMDDTSMTGVLRRAQSINEHAVRQRTEAIRSRSRERFPNSRG